MHPHILFLTKKSKFNTLNYLAYRNLWFDTAWKFFPEQMLPLFSSCYINANVKWKYIITFSHVEIYGCQIWRHPPTLTFITSEICTFLNVFKGCSTIYRELWELYFFPAINFGLLKILNIISIWQLFISFTNFTE